MIKLVKVIYGPDPKTDFDAGLVVGNDPNIGITIINADDPKDFLLCSIGPLDPRHVNDGMWEVHYSEWNRQIKTGIVNFLEWIDKFGPGSKEEPSEKTCSFAL